MYEPLHKHIPKKVMKQILTLAAVSSSLNIEVLASSGTLQVSSQI
jgi:hypothetical protein